MDTLDRGGLQAPIGLQAPWWRQLRRARWSSRWPGVAAAVLGATLLTAFVQVVLAGARNSEDRNRAIAARADALWRCNALRTTEQRARCRVQVDAAPPALPAP